VQELVETSLPALRPAQHRWLAEWLAGTLIAESSCERADLAALES
jgi:hypothetical protein